MNRKHRATNYYYYYRACKTSGGEYKAESPFQSESREFNFPWRLHGTTMKFCLSPPHRGESPSCAPFWKTCVACVQEVWRLCNWVVACPDPDECRVTSVPLIFCSSFVEMSITEGTSPSNPSTTVFVATHESCSNFLCVCVCVCRGTFCRRGCAMMNIACAGLKGYNTWRDET